MDNRVALLLAICLIFIFIRLLRTGRRPRDYPPGPPTLPIIGNIHQVGPKFGLERHSTLEVFNTIMITLGNKQMPNRDAHKQFQAWAKQYGPVYSLILGTKTLVVLSSDQAVKDLLDKRSAIYSDRQDMYIGMTLCSADLRMLMMVRFLSLCPLRSIRTCVFC